MKKSLTYLTLFVSLNALAAPFWGGLDLSLRFSDEAGEELNAQANTYVIGLADGLTYAKKACIPDYVTVKQLTEMVESFYKQNQQYEKYFAADVLAEEFFQKHYPCE